MSAYRVLWNVLVAALGGLGAVVALLAIEGGVVFSVAALSGTVTAATHYALVQGSVRRVRTKDLPSFAALGVGVGVALAGYIELSGPVWIPGALLLVAVSPAVLGGLGPVLRCLSAMAGYLSDPVHADSTVGGADSPFEPALGTYPPAVVAVSAMTMAELCAAWRSSFLALCRLRDGDPVGRAHLVSSRQQYLDELETRDPAGFSRWLAAGAGPGSDPGKYLRGVEVPGPGPNDADPRPRAGGSARGRR